MMFLFFFGSLFYELAGRLRLILKRRPLVAQDLSERVLSLAPNLFDDVAHSQNNAAALVLVRRRLELLAQGSKFFFDSGPVPIEHRNLRGTGKYTLQLRVCRSNRVLMGGSGTCSGDPTGSLTCIWGGHTPSPGGSISRSVRANFKAREVVQHQSSGEFP